MSTLVQTFGQACLRYKYIAEDKRLDNNRNTDGFSKAVKGNIKKATFFVKITVCILALLMLTLVVALFIDVLGMNIEYTLEAGDVLPSAQSLVGKAGAEYDFGDGDGEFNTPGEYEFYIVYGNRRTKVKLTVEDTTAPKAELLHLYVNQNGPFPAAIDFFEDVKDASEVTAKFKNGVNPTELGDYEIQLELSDSYGNRKNYKTVMTLIVDTEAPVITGPASISGYVGEGIAYQKDIEVTDNCFVDIDVQVDSSAVDTSKAGSYKVRYTATDKAGNSSNFELTVNIYAEKVTRDMLMSKIETLSATLGITKSMSKESQVKKIYAYVNSPKLSAGQENIVFNGESNTDRSDWMREAYLALQSGSGDCYSYFAVSKAFFEYFEIENIDIERAKGVTTQSGTHFWSMVNIGTEKAPQWYYYDATRLAKPHKTGSGCLFTEAQLDDYNNNVSVGFLTFDHTDYPKASTNTINTGYSW